MVRATLFSSVMALVMLVGCASPSTDESDEGVEGSGQAATSCRPFLLDVSVAGRGAAFERSCGAEGSAEWALVYNTVIGQTPVRARYVSRGPQKAQLDKAIEGMARDGMTEKTTTFFTAELEPALARLLAATDDARKQEAREKVRSLMEEHLLSLD